MKKILEYKPNINNPESFIAYKFAMMPDKVITNNNTFKESNTLLFMNSEFIKLVYKNFSNEKFHRAINLDILLAIKNIVKDSIHFYYYYDEKAQKYSKKFKNKRNYLESFPYKGWKNDILIAKYFCLKEAYDLEIPIDRIKEFDIETAEKLMININSLIGVNFSLKYVKSIEKSILSQLREDLKKNKKSKTLEFIAYDLRDMNLFRALVCSNEIIDIVSKLNEMQKISEESLDFIISLIDISVEAKKHMLGNAIENIINLNNLKNFDEEKAQELKKELIRKKYSKKYAVKYMKRV